MIISNLTGGLGNQMFQYAFGRYLAIKNKTELKLHFTNALFNTQYSYGLYVFNIEAEIASDEDLRKMNVVQNRTINRLLYLFDERLSVQLNKHIVTQEYPYIFDYKYFSIKDNSYIQGFWQDVRYFKEIEQILRKEFTLKNKLDEKNQNILKQIQKTNAVCMHVRREDKKIDNMDKITITSLEYKNYINAIKLIEKKIKNPEYFIFSNDISWCKYNLTFLLKKAYFIDYNRGIDSYKDLILMSKCKNNILAKSTFSSWSTWLNTYDKKIIIKF